MTNDTATFAIYPDSRLAARMARVYNAELNQVILYTYQHLLTEGLDSEASELFRRLAREDMAHVYALGRLIRALGGDPGVSMRMSTPRVDLSTDASCRSLPVVRRMLSQDMQAEAALITELESLSAAAEQEPVVAILRGIILDEREGYERLERVLRELEGT